MDFSSYYYYIPLNFYETPEMTLIDHEPNGDSATVLVLALAKIHTRTVTKNDDGTFTIVTDDGTFTDTEVMDMLSSFGYRANHAKYTHALAVVARFPPFDHLAYSEAERDKKTPEVYREAPRSVAQGLQRVLRHAGSPTHRRDGQCGLHLHRLRPSTIACGEMRLRREAPSPRKRSLHRRDACCGH